jgi:hypothetical protein
VNRLIDWEFISVERDKREKEGKELCNTRNNTGVRNEKNKRN